MQVQKIQSNQPNFGTRVQISAMAAKMINAAKKTDKFIEQVKILEKNGQDDVMSITWSSLWNQLRADLTRLYKGNESKLPYKEKLSGWVDVDNLEESYKVMGGASKTNLDEGMEKLFPYIV